MPSQLNMADRVHPYHWDTSSFEESNVSPQAEFDLIAPVAIYFLADIAYRNDARSAWKKLRKMSHPVSCELTPSQMVKESEIPDGVHERYNALFMYLCKQQWPECVFGEDKWGALFVKKGAGESDEFAGDAHGQFKWFGDFASLQERLILDVGC